MTELFVPGRLEFLGKHTDYAGGRSLLCPIERGIRLTVEPRDDGIVRVRDARAGESVECSFDPNLDRPRGHWANYPYTVVRRLARDFPSARVGADIVFDSDLPQAAGMSSSSALVVGIVMALVRVNELESDLTYARTITSLEDFAEYAGSVENGSAFRCFQADGGVGTLNGCEDQTAILCGRAGSLVRYAFCPVRFEGTHALPPSHVFAIASSGVVAEKTAAALERYNALSLQATAAAAVWRRESGRDDSTLGAAIRAAGAEAVHDAIVRSKGGEFSATTLTRRFEHFVMESEMIIPAVSAALDRGDLATVGALVAQSQIAADEFLRNQVAETRALVRLANDLDATAASAFGAGFGGSVWAMVPEPDASSFVDEWRWRYTREFPVRRDSCDFFITRAGNPAAQR